MSDYSNWEKQFNKGIKLTLKASEDILEDASKEFKTQVAERTPIGHPWEWKNPPHYDYVPGALRQAWAVSKVSNQEYVVYNPRPYALRVEEGWSKKQAPAGMMRITALDFPLIIEKASKRHKV